MSPSASRVETLPERTEETVEIEEAEEVAVEEEPSRTTSPERRDRTLSRLSRRLRRSSPRYEREDFCEVLTRVICMSQWTRSEHTR